jgi:hypothetical protein
MATNTNNNTDVELSDIVKDVIRRFARRTRDLDGLFKNNDVLDQLRAKFAITILNIKAWRGPYYFVLFEKKPSTTNIQFIPHTLS